MPPPAPMPALRRPQTRSENKTSVSGAVATGFDKRGYCANAGSGSTQFCICNHTIDGCLRESQLNCKRARNICKRSASTRVDGTPAWQRQRERWPDPWNEFNPRGWWARMEIWRLNFKHVLERRELQHSKDHFIFGINNHCKLYNKKGFAQCLKDSAVSKQLSGTVLCGKALLDLK